MKFERGFIFICLIICLFSVASVCATEFDDATTYIENTTPLESSIDNEIIEVDDSEKIEQPENDEIISEVEAGNFSELRQKIINAGNDSTITLDRNYEYDGSGAIEFSNSNMTLDGNGYTIDAKKQTRVFTIWGSNVTIKNITFINAKNNAIHFNGAGGIVSDCTFINNTARIGSAIYWNQEDGRVSGCTFINNTVELGGGAIFWNADGGIVSGCTFINNKAESFGGAIEWDVGQGTVSDCIFINNIAELGGAVCLNQKDSSVSYCTFINNTAKYGGATYWKQENGRVSYCTFINNTAHNQGDAIYTVKDLSGEYCWFGNDASNYNDSLPANNKFHCDLILFLNATADLNTLPDLNTSDVIFKLYLYNSSSEMVSEYDNAPFENLNFTITATNGVADKNSVKPGETIRYTPTDTGIGTVTASIGCPVHH